MEENQPKDVQKNFIEISPITTSEQLEFAIFCIENLARQLGVDAAVVYDALTKKSSILNSYIVPEYEMLHTQSKEYILNDILDFMQKRGVQV